MNRIVLLFLLCGVAMWLPCAAQNSTDPLSLQGKHAITVSGGMKMDSKSATVVNLTGIDLESGFTGSLSYGYWFDESWQVNFSAGVFGGGTKINYSGVSTGTIIPVLFGITYCPRQMALGAVGRPFVGVAGGAYTGTATRTGFLGVGAVTETVPGGRFTIGVDFLLTNWLKLGPSFSYHFLGDFSTIGGNKKNFKGAEFSVSFGMVL